MAKTKTKYEKPGQPTLYKPEYCELLIEHMEGGNSFESFGGKLRHHKQTLYNWAAAHPDFFDAKKIGTAMSLLYWENMGRMIASGQLRRLKSEEPMIDANGKAMYDDDGKMLMRKTYEPAVPGQASWIFMLKNMHGWRDRVDMEVSGKDGGPINFSNMTDEELKKQLALMQEEASKYLKK